MGLPGRGGDGVKRSALQRKSPLKPDPEQVREFQQRARRNSRPKRRAVSPASRAQRSKCRLMPCVVCGSPNVDPAHLIDRSLCPTGADDPRAVVSLCRYHHEQYDLHQLSLLEYLEPHFREELAFAVERVGLVSAYKRLTGDWGMERVA